MKIFITPLLALLFCKCQAQDPLIEKSVYGIQTGLLGVWIYNEHSIFNPLTLRTELGFEASEISYSSTFGWNYVVSPTIKLQPRWYYNLKRRQARDKKIEKNTGDFLAINFTYVSRVPAVSSYDKSLLPNKITLTAMWGIRRHAGKHFCFEAGVGGGFGYEFYNSENTQYNGTYSIFNIYQRIGYTF